MEHRIKAPCNKHYVSKEGGGTGKAVINPRKNVTHRPENNHPFVQPNYTIESGQHPTTKENYVSLKRNK
jgi:hypothetical protein